MMLWVSSVTEDPGLLLVVGQFFLRIRGMPFEVVELLGQPVGSLQGRSIFRLEVVLDIGSGHGIRTSTI